MGSEPVYSAECHCGRIKFQVLVKDPLDAKYCHCRTCQSLHGAPFQWAAIVAKTDVFFPNGSEGIDWYPTDTRQGGHVLPCKASCSYCHAPILDEGRNMLMLFPTLIRFPGVEARRRWYPTCHIFYSQRVCDVVDGKPKWSRHKRGEGSILLDDNGVPTALNGPSPAAT